jgi:hypothetical protein
MTYKIKVCKFCRHQTEWLKRDYGWFCPNYAHPSHGNAFHGYIGPNNVEDLELVPAADLATERNRSRFDRAALLELEDYYDDLMLDYYDLVDDYYAIQRYS